MNESKDKKILYVIGSLELGGAEKHLTNIMIRLKQRGWHPSLFVLSPGGPLTEQIEKYDIHIYAPQSFLWFQKMVKKIKNKRWRSYSSFLFYLLNITKLFWREKPDVLHFFLPTPYIIGGIASLFSPTKIRIMSRRSLNFYQKNHRALSILERWLHKSLTLACANSKAVENDLRSELIPQSKIRLIYNGIDTGIYEKDFNREEERLKENIPVNALVFIIVANLIPYKGHLDLIEAFSKIKDKLPKSWVLLCVGRDDGIGQSLEKAVVENGLKGKVRFLGSRLDSSRLFRLSDIGILCSHEEGFSNSILEGMAAGLPMVVTDVGGNAEAVVHKETGFVVPPHNPEELAQAILKLAVNSELIGQMGQKGKRRVSTNFSIESCVANYEKLYDELS